MTEPYAVPDMDELLAQVRKQTEEVQRIQRTVEAMEVKAASRQNEVTVTLRGDGRFTSVDIDQRAIREYDARTLSEIVLEAVNAGLQKLAEASSAKFAPVIEASRSQQ
ncbi:MULTISPECIES: YbaB/EbfC family nucleoid-associated protein [Amycolatopsis]|uniref:YbaB/EbfC family nucleoid-associated protein n=2 Tax=Amycolatopsis TaxID=1813 RepID=A0A7W3W7C9_9PSEU|nr:MULTISPECIES: YbaB/EbfC family nucleoid-associated protein [Amycolatopsis]MBB1160160.1 YbaB/EbfC family nucleoid-associated protein [Amycolatopsis dendrobii]MCG3756437.1 YbaB/EbfC family nucleoid-associated protein [Amycolatopsis sp. Poz14]UKD55420.1 YbaB/EbfC family nucleoid-associated protein [Amycolatopsis sp. FU40]